MSSALQAVVESYTSEVLMHKKHRLLDIIVGARATASDVLEPQIVQNKHRFAGWWCNGVSPLHKNWYESINFEYYLF